MFPSGTVPAPVKQAPPVPPPQPPKPAPGSKDAKRQAEMNLIAASTPARPPGQPFPGTQRQAVQQAPPASATPPPAPTGNSTTDQIPQEQTPVFQAPQYHAPAKGLEYALLGLSLLFPGAPIARMATGALQGLQAGAEGRYNRDLTTAESQYQQQAAQMKSAYTNAVAQYNAAQDMRNRGIDPQTQRPFVLPPQLQRILPPGTRRAPGAMDYFNHETALANFYESVGAGQVATLHRQLASDYERQAIDEANNARSLAIAQFNQQQQNAREDKRESAALQREEEIQAGALRRERETQEAADRREDKRLGVEIALRTATTPKEMDRLRTEHSHASQEFWSAWNKALKPPTGPGGQPVTLMDPKNPQQTLMNADGTPRTAPAPISGPLVQQLGKVFSTIDRAKNPTAAADYYQNSVTNPLARELIQMRGRAADLARRSKGLPIDTTETYAPIGGAGTPNAGGKTITAAGIKKYAKDHGVSEEQAKKDAEANGYTVTP